MSDAPIYAATLDGLVDLRAPESAHLTLRAVAHGLGGINRWANATELPVNVAQHSEVCFEIFCRAFPKLRARAIYALLHDAHEYLIGDITAPAQRLLAHALPTLDVLVAYWKGQWDTAIRRNLRVPEIDPARDADLLAAVHAADLLAADLEWRTFMSPVNGKSPYAEIARDHRHGVKFKPVRSPAAAEARFLELVAHELEARPWEAA